MKTLTVETRKHCEMIDVTALVQAAVAESGVRDGFAVCFVPHTTAGVTIQENADPDVLRDLEHWMTRLVPDGDPSFLHTLEGDDDMPAHIRTALTRSGEAIPFAEGRLLLGTWQGVYFCEFDGPRTRKVCVSIQEGVHS